MSFDDWLAAEGLTKGDIDFLMNAGITSVKALRNCAKDTAEFYADVFSEMLKADKTNKMTRRIAVGAAYENAVMMGIEDERKMAEDRKKIADIALVAAEKEREGTNLHELTVRAAEISAIKAQAEAIRQAPGGQVRKVHAYIYREEYIYGA